MTDFGSDTASYFDGLLATALSKPGQNTRRYDDLADALASVLDLPADNIWTKLVSDVSAQFDNRLGEVVFRTKSAQAISFLQTPDPSDLQSELAKAADRARKAAADGRYEGITILWAQDTSKGPWSVRRILSPASLLSSARRLGDALQDPSLVEAMGSGAPAVRVGPSSVSDEPAIWLEFSKSEHLHGGHGWELGTCLWSPTTDIDGGDRYAVMREPDVGDLVVHSVDSTFRGISRVARPARAIPEEPPSPGSWGGRESYYRIELEGFREFERAVSIGDFLERYRLEVLEEIRDGQPPKYYPFHIRGGEGPSPELRTGQGAYLTRLTPRLFGFISEAAETKPIPSMPEPPFTIDDAMDGLFLTKEEFQQILSLLRTRKNVVLQGPPGVGKTFLAKRLAYALIESKRPHRVETVQFHPSYSYEDFVQGWRPQLSGGFSLAPGVFHRFCTERAAGRPSHEPHVFVIDEINRGNLPKILGELMMLIEDDKRGPDFAIPLTYSRPADQPFFVPENVHVLGLMNTADRSLALVDFALRRRFAFFDLKPAFGRPAFRSYLERRGVPSALVSRIEDRFTALNKAILSDTKNLGPGFEVGHSYFCRPLGKADPETWYRSIVEAEVSPLLSAYWFDDLETASRWRNDLLK
jgi:hypothetical protein